MELPLFAELKRRRIFRALVGYGIAAFAVLQIIEPIMHGLRWPDAVLSYVVAALAVGFPVVVGLAWIFDVNAGRMIRTQGDPVGALRGARLLLVLVGIGVLAAAPGVVWYFVVRGIARTALRDKSIAVLPFASLNAGEDTAFFADGIHGDLLTQLSKIGDLKVISRTSVLQYRTGTRNLREIGEALGVATVLEGSVQRADNRVRIEARLSDTHDDRQIWADRYDRELTDVFAIQSAVTEEIARALKARLSPEEKGRIERRPTRSTEAYELYLRGREYEERPNQLAGDFRIAEQMYRRAIEKDPGFALAHARLSYLDTSRFYWYQIDASEARLAEAAREAERALTLDPDLAEAHIAAGNVPYVQRDFSNAAKEFAVAAKLDPNSVTVWISLAYSQRRQGAFEQAVRNMERVSELEPRSLFVEDLAYTLTMLRRYEEAERAFDRVLAWAPDNDIALIDKSRLMLSWKGDDGLARTILRNLPARIDPSGTLTLNKHILDLMKLYPREAVAALAPSSIEFFTARQGVLPRALIEAMVAAADGDSARALAKYEEARARLEAELKKKPAHEFRYHIALGRALAGLRRNADALREARTGVELLPISKDAIDGPSVLEELAAVYAATGDTDAAIREIEYLLSTPGYLSPALLRIDPKWLPLHGDPRFRRLAGL